MFNVDKQRFYTILWLGKSAWSRLIKLLGFTPFPFSSIAFPLLLQTHEQRTAHTHLTAQQGQASSHEAKAETWGHACIQQRAHPAPSAAGAGQRLWQVALLHHNSWCFEWAEGGKPTFPVQLFEPTAVQGPSRDSDRLDRSNILALITFPFILLVCKAVHNCGAGHSCPPWPFPVLPVTWLESHPRVPSVPPLYGHWASPLSATHKAYSLAPPTLKGCAGITNPSLAAGFQQQVQEWTWLKHNTLTCLQGFILSQT